MFWLSILENKYRLCYNAVMDTFDCAKMVDNLQRQLKQVRYNSDLQKMYKNIENMVSVISQLEVHCRQKKNYSAMEEPIERFKESVDRLEKLILIAKLID